MTISVPFASQEVRWFFEGRSDRHKSLRHWFETATPIAKRPGVSAPAWQRRLDNQPDIYLIIPGSDDLGIKWREGEFQVKGRVSSLGTQVYGGRHRGGVECWVKWSYRDMPAAYKNLFVNAHRQDLKTVAIHKVRALRKVRIDTITGQFEEVDSTTRIDRGLSIELTDLRIDSTEYSSLAVEAFPDDSAMGGAFARIVETFLNALTEIDLDVEQSRSYPAWLDFKFNA